MAGYLLIDMFGNKIHCNLNDETHSEMGPAVEEINGDKHWFLNDNWIETQEKFEQLMKLKAFW